MSRIRCPGCGKVHVLTEAVEAPFKKRCLRCAESFLVTADQVQGQALDGPDHAAVAQRMVAAQAGEARPSPKEEGAEAAPLPARVPRDPVAFQHVAAARRNPFTPRRDERLRDAPVKQVIVTDSIPLPPHKQLPQIKVLSVAPLLADAIKRIHFNESVSKLFE